MALALPQNGIIGIGGQPVVSESAKIKHFFFNEEEDTKQEIWRRLGDIEDIELLFNDVLVAKYIRKKVSKNLDAAPETQREDQWQGVVGMVLKLGPTAFVDDEHTKFPKWTKAIMPNDWVVYRSSDGWDKDIAPAEGYHAVKCRVIQDGHIRMRTRYPGRLL
jgi:hypothetical protein